MINLPSYKSLFPSSSQRRRIALLRDTEEMMDAILPMCYARPNIYSQLSETLSIWILELEEIDDEAALENILMDVQSSFTTVTEIDCKDSLRCSNNGTTLIHDGVISSNSSSNSHITDEDYNDKESKENIAAGSSHSVTNASTPSTQLPRRWSMGMKQTSDTCLIRKTEKRDSMDVSSVTFLSRDQIEFLSSATCTTIDEIQLDLNFLKDELLEASKNSLQIRNTIRDFIRKLESDISVYQAIKRNKNKRYEKEWNSERDLLLRILNDLKEKIFVARRNSNGSNQSGHQSYYQQLTRENELHHPHANVYNQILTHYLSHTRPLPPYDNDYYNNVCEDHNRWKRPERPTSLIRWNDMQTIDELLSQIPLDDEDNSKFAAASRVCTILLNIRECCHKEAQILSKEELEEARQQKIEQERRQEMRRFKRRNNRMSLSFKALSIDARKQLLGQMD
eukprot:CAMPEP_0194133634 /NCGR_PEP_ID=MMETSP0152-20130528/3724_1 /TAXON_ID=1049557 /ORGANISM="Thalassiothrix antarctica, Strain L6-D1" /LENGTH=450 /DNA_ID=CAMNT_0038828977 /DNA_START=10 /DNA_END=1362 /DNA_ORIENTATION=+